MDEILAEPRVNVVKVVADMVERHDIRGLMGHTGKLACEYCTCEAPTVGSKVCWPYPQCLAKDEQARTHEGTKNIAR